MGGMIGGGVWYMYIVKLRRLSEQGNLSKLKFILTRIHFFLNKFFYHVNGKSKQTEFFLYHHSIIFMRKNKQLKKPVIKVS